MFLSLLVGMLTNCASQHMDVWRNIERLKKQGEFSQATQLIQKYLEEKPTLSESERKRLLWEVEWMRRVRLDYKYTREDILKQLEERVADFKPEEMDRWEREGKFDSRIIDGQMYYMYASVSNLFKRYPEIRKREVPRPERAEYEKGLWEHYQAILQAHQKTPDRLLLPQRYQVTMTVTVKPDAVPAGETIRCWIPYPRIYPHQTDVTFLSSSPEVQWVDDPLSPIRSVYLEQKAEKGQPTVFRLTYAFTTYAVYCPVDPQKIRPYDTSRPEYQTYTREQPPHVVFTPELKKLARKIVGSETNPYLQAKKVYQWISQNIRYSYALEYSTIPNISMYCYEHRYGDCGQEALLFITLCRILGIPARWQSGWSIGPKHKTIHDWAEVYFEPYGWLPVEPYMGIYITQYMETLSEEQKKALHDFYFGNLDHFRLIVNSDHNQHLYPPKMHFRSDDVDFQRGEVEWKGGNLYFDQWDYELKVERLESGSLPAAGCEI